MSPGFPVVPDQEQEITPDRTSDHGDWLGGPRSFAWAWGLPIAVLVAAGVLDPVPRTLTAAGALTWMGAACLANAFRCGRMHCYFTGPFFLAMAIATLLHGFEIVWLGPQGWRLLGFTTGVGGGALWFLPEVIFGKFKGRKT